MYSAARYLVALCALVVAAGAVAPAQTGWRRLDSPNFVVIGDVSAGALRDIARKFEGYREMLGRVLNPRLIGAAVPTVVVVFPGEHQIAPFRPKFNGKPVDVAGLFMPGRDLNYIAFVNDGNKAREQVIFHEYTHLLTANAGQPIPLWLKEGLAEYYSTFELFRDGREAIVGGLLEWHLGRLNDTILMPIAELLKVDHTSPLYNHSTRRSVFYAQSWALVHMVFVGQPSRAPQLAVYLDRVSRGADAESAWQEAFGTLNMDQELARYIQKTDYRGLKYTFADAVATFDAAAVAMSPADVQSFLAGVLVQLDDKEAAAERLAQAAKLDPDNAKARIGLARLNLARQQQDDSEAWLRALSPPPDWYQAYLATVTLAELIQRSGRKPTAEDLDVVQRFMSASRTASGEFPNAVARAANLELIGGEVPTAETAAALERARARAPGRHDYTFLHTHVLVRRAEFTKAREVLAPLLSNYSQPIREEARRLMGSIVEFELRTRPGAAPGRLPPVPPGLGTAPPAPAAQGSGAPALPETSGPVFRVVKPGEERVQGVLERIECVQGRGITFHLKVGDTPQTATASAFSDVDFITFRPDLTGSVKCGPLEPPMPVYLTWRPGPAAGVRLAVAVEFLPKPR